MERNGAEKIMPDPGTIAGGGAVLAVLAREVWGFFKGDMKKVSEEVLKLPAALAKLIEELDETKDTVTKSYELARDQVTKLAATGDRQIELLRELITIVKQLQTDITELKIRNKYRGGE